MSSDFFFIFALFLVRSPLSLNISCRMNAVLLGFHLTSSFFSNSVFRVFSITCTTKQCLFYDYFTRPHHSSQHIRESKLRMKYLPIRTRTKSFLLRSTLLASLNHTKKAPFSSAPHFKDLLLGILFLAIIGVNATQTV